MKDEAARLKATFLKTIQGWSLDKNNPQSPAIANDAGLQEILLRGYESLINYAEHLGKLQAKEMSAGEKQYNAFSLSEPSNRIEIMQSLVVIPFYSDLKEYPLIKNYSHSNL